LKILKFYKFWIILKCLRKQFKELHGIQFWVIPNIPKILLTMEPSFKKEKNLSNTVMLWMDLRLSNLTWSWSYSIYLLFLMRLFEVWISEQVLNRISKKVWECSKTNLSENMDKSGNSQTINWLKDICYSNKQDKSCQWVRTTTSSHPKVKARKMKDSNGWMFRLTTKDLMLQEIWTLSFHRASIILKLVWIHLI